MNAKQILSILLLASLGGSTVRAEDVVPSPDDVPLDVPFGFSDGGMVSTEVGSGLYGMGAFARSVGDYNYNTARAARELEEARTRAIMNHKLAVETWFDLKRQNKQFRASKLEPLSASQLSVTLESQRPVRLTDSQYSAVTGKLSWPVALLGGAFESQRVTLDRAFGSRTSRDGGSESAFYARVHRATEVMLTTLRDRIELFSPNEYMAAKKFLLALRYEALSPSNPTALAVNDR